MPVGILSAGTFFGTQMDSIQLEEVIRHMARTELAPIHNASVMESERMLRHYIGQYQCMAKELPLTEIMTQFHDLLDKTIRSSKDEEANNIQCHAGCSHCCKIPVCITEGEAQILYHHAKKNGIHLSKSRLELQTKFTSENWRFLGKARACVFLRNDKCSVYEVRPAACRSHFSASPPFMCNNAKYPTRKIKIWRPFEVSVINTALTIIGNTDFMPAKLLEQIKKDVV